MNDTDDAKKIASLNDAFRRSLQGGRVMMTQGIAALPFPDQFNILSQVRAFRDFTEENDPYGEHDYGSFDAAGERILWKIDYYNRAMDAGSEDPTDPQQTTRVLTIMLAHEY